MRLFPWETQAGQRTGSISPVELLNSLLGVEMRFVGDKRSALGAPGAVVLHVETHNRPNLFKEALLRISRANLGVEEAAKVYLEILLGELVVDVVNADLGPSGVAIRPSASVSRACSPYSTYSAGSGEGPRGPRLGAGRRFAAGLSVLL